MTIEYVTIAVLVGVLVLQQFYWALVCYNLVNRIMSRNYFEYTQGQNNLKPISKPKTLQLAQDEQIDPETERQAKDLNSLMGMV